MCGLLRRGESGYAPRGVPRSDCGVCGHLVKSSFGKRKI
jgi:hypothetical protein